MGMTGDSHEDIGEIGLRIDFVCKAARDQSLHYGQVFSSFVVADKEKVFAAKSDESQVLLGNIVVESDLRVGKKTLKGFSLIDSTS